MSLCTTTYAKTLADIARVDTTRLQALLDAATDMIESYCDRTFAAADYTNYIDGNDQRWIYVHNAPINSITSVVIKGTDDLTETIAGTEFRYDSTIGKIEFKPSATSSYGYFPKGFENIQINYNGGWATIPAAVQEACALAARNLYARSGGGTNPAYTDEKMGEHTYKRQSANTEIITPDIAVLLAKYCRTLIVG